MTENAPTGVVAVDVERCMGCRACELACAGAHAGVEDIVEALLAGVHLVPRVRVVATARGPVPVICQHCEDAQCVAVCPTQALEKEEGGAVRLLADKCVQCRACVAACPFGAIEWHEASESVIKCDLCAGIVGVGLDTRCVAACPVGALCIVPAAKLHEARRRATGPRTIEVFSAEQAVLLR